jgi:hypothetical protein
MSATLVISCLQTDSNVTGLRHGRRLLQYVHGIWLTSNLSEMVPNCESVRSSGSTIVIMFELRRIFDFAFLAIDQSEDILGPWDAPLVEDVLFETATPAQLCANLRSVYTDSCGI